ncbi:hypothetical protein T281_14725 [Rhodomicrobium udaipurense JA643]|uniref:DUF4864 domain-containing protein n=1 Tax=Rhodomicrobium udaipurense TaxID=1202716 RepID=A0A8I1GI29_9HYPH|nr:hypothetical protein [Rhodomicrobium udaipurense]KAI93762.1 hypothetical protein T281_14725 [Rhodomicrobium udaipurense JA643]MBJ7544731.1 hypothetical protein [Rhodomicrobium udaipurense]
MRVSLFRFCLNVACLTVFVATAAAQSKAPPAPQKTPAQAGQAKMTIDTLEIVILIKSTIMALQHANQTGNYSVLRDLGSPVFRERFDQAQLTAIFTNLRNRGVSLNPALVLTPNLVRQPELTPQNQLRLVGDFPTKPLQIQYDLLFLKVGNVWRIEGIMVDAVAPPAAVVANPESSPSKASEPAKPAPPAAKATPPRPAN